MLTNQLISYGLSILKKRNHASLLSANQTYPTWFEALERSRQSFGLDNIRYEYWTYPSAQLEGCFWVKNSKNVVLMLSEGFMKTATESQIVAMMESLNASTLQKTRRINKRTAIKTIIRKMKGESSLFRFWVLSFFLYPLERFLKIAKI